MSGSFMEPRILGGRMGTYYGTVIEDQFVAVYNWPLGAALSFILLAVVLVILGLTSPILRNARTWTFHAQPHRQVVACCHSRLSLRAPIAVMAAMSLNASPFYQPITVPNSRPTGILKIASNAQVLEATTRFGADCLRHDIHRTALGTAASIALFRYDFPGRKLLQMLLFPPIAIPWLITGTAMLIFFFSHRYRSRHACRDHRPCGARPALRDRYRLRTPCHIRPGTRGSRARSLGARHLDGCSPRDAAVDRAGRGCRSALRLRRQLRSVRRELFPVGAGRQHAAGADLHGDPQRASPRNQCDLDPHHHPFHGHHVHGCRYSQFGGKQYVRVEGFQRNEEIRPG
ncbi:MAG: hypothetical protein R3C97_06265 [Geminicoccaceae bacterium]